MRVEASPIPRLCSMYGGYCLSARWRLPRLELYDARLHLVGRLDRQVTPTSMSCLSSMSTRWVEVICCCDPFGTGPHLKRDEKLSRW